MEWTIGIDAMADRGRAIGRHEGKAVFVPFAAPGDVAVVRVEREKPGFAEARLVRLETPSPFRVTPECPLFGRCGGCAWQHLPYEIQTRGKAESFKSFCATRLGGADGVAFAPFLPSPLPYGYRNRVSLTVAGTGKRLRLGFSEEASHRVLAVGRCPVLTPALNALLPELPEALSSPAARPLAPRKARLQEDGEGGVWATLEVSAPPGRRALEAAGALARELGLRSAGLEAPGERGRKGPPGQAMPIALEAQGKAFRFHVPPGGFVQANPGVNARLLAALTARRDLYAGRPALDLYAGSGNFTLPLALDAARVTAVEESRPAARALEANARANGLSNVEARPGQVHRALEGIPPGTVSFCLLDPPREGAAETIEPLLRLAPDVIAYISCAPPTLARDLTRLIQGGYRLLSLRAADMFPQTAHVESLALLTRSDGVDGVF